MTPGKSRSWRSDLPIWLRAAVSQLAGAVLVGVGFLAIVRAGGSPPPLVVALAVGAVAATFGHAFFRLPPWWIVIHVGFPPAVLLAAGADAPGWIYGALFVVSLLVFWNALRDRVPLYLTNQTAAAAVARFVADAGTTPGESGRFCDLGSGPGGFAMRVAGLMPDWHVIGVESSPVLFGLAVLRRRLSGPANVRFRRDDIWDTDLGPFDAVYAFLSPAPMERLFAKAKSEMRPGGLFISNSFPVPGIAPDEVVEVGDGRRTRLLVWRM